MIVQGINDNHLLSFKLIDEIIKDKKIVGTFIKNSAEITATNINHVYNVLYDNYVTIQGLGKWYVNEINDDEANVQIKMKLFDLSQKFDQKYDDTFSFPATMKQWATWIGLKVGVPLSGDFPNSDVVLTNRPYIGNNPTYRNAVMLIATYAGSYARTNYDNTYSICWFDETLNEIEDFISFEHGDRKPAVNTLVLSTGDTNDNIEYPEVPVENPVELRIEDDFNYVDRYDLLVAIYNQVNGFNYVPIKKLEVPYGLLGVRAGGMISCQDLERNDIESFVSYHCLQWQGGAFDDPNSWKSTLKMSELNETNTNHKFAQSIPNELLEVKRETNKNTGEIEDLIDKTTVLETSIKEITPYFAVNTSKTTAPTTGWQTTMPTRQVNEYMWRKDKITLQNDTEYYETPYVVTGDRGNDGTSGSEIWTTSTAPTTPNYTFNKSNLLGPPGDPIVGDIILYSYYRYTIDTVGTTTVKAGNRQSLRGAKGDTGDTGPAGQDGAPGQDGADGSQWYQGTDITGTSGNLTGHAGVVDDQYLNSSTGNTYVCVTTGSSSTAIWHYSGNIKGADGEDATITSPTEPPNPTENMLWLDTTNNVLKKYTITSDQGGVISGTWYVVNDYADAIGNVQHNVDTATSNLQTAISEVNDTLGSRVEIVENKYTSMEQTQEGFELKVGKINTFLYGNGGEDEGAQKVISNVESSFTFGNSLLIGKSDSDYKFELTNTGANILYKGNTTSWWDPHNFNSDGIQTNQLGIGSFKWSLRSNGSLSFRKEG